MKRIILWLKGKPRVLAAAWFLAAAALSAFAFGGVLGLIAGSVWACITTMFWFFSAHLVVAASLLLFTNIDEGWTYGLGCGLYYGTVFGAWIFRRMDEYEAAFVVSALICYIVYSKYHGKD